MSGVEVIIELIKGGILFAFAIVKNVGSFILGLGFPMSVIVIVLICVAFFIIYQQSEHVLTSGVTRFMISAIIVIGITFGLVTFILP